MLKPEQTQWHSNCVENKVLAADPLTVLGMEFMENVRMSSCHPFEKPLEATTASGLFPIHVLGGLGRSLIP